MRGNVQGRGDHEGPDAGLACSRSRKKGMWRAEGRCGENRETAGESDNRVGCWPW